MNVDLDILERFLNNHPEIVERMEEIRRRANEKQKKSITDRCRPTGQWN